MAATVLDGKALAETVRQEVKAGVEAFAKAYGRAPGLEVILVGEDPASVVYTRNKEKAAREVGMRGQLHTLPKEAAEAEVLSLVERLNADPDVDGILVQLPLPPSMHAERVLDAVRFEKDVDGLHPMNAGLLAVGRPRLAPCTPLGCMRLLELSGATLAGAHAVIVGRSNLVGRPLAQLLLRRDATVTLAHSKTRDLPALCRSADLLVAAAGQPNLVRGDWVRPGAVVIDVGTSRVVAADGKARLVGDVAFDEVREHAAAVTPVPGGVGPLTIAMLLANTVSAAEMRAGFTRAE